MPRARTNPRRKASTGGSTPSAGPAVADPPVGEYNQAGARGVRIEDLDPRAITWPEGYIESEYDQDRLLGLQGSLTGGRQESSIGVMEMEDGSYVGTGGKHRCEVAISSGWETIRCEVTSGTLPQALDANMANALNQSKPSVISEIDGVGRHFHNLSKTIVDIMEISGKSGDWVESRLRIFDACQASPALRQYVSDGTVVVGKAALLAKVEDLAEMEQLLRDLLSYGWTTEQLEAGIRGDNDPPDASHGSPTPRPTPERKPVVCSHCEIEQEASDTTTLTLCPDCIGRMKLVENQVLMTGANEIAMPRKMAQEIRDFLAGSQQGAGMAAQVDRLLDVGE